MPTPPIPIVVSVIRGTIVNVPVPLEASRADESSDIVSLFKTILTFAVEVPLFAPPM